MRNGDRRARRDPDAIEREIAATRARMETTLSSLESNLTLGHLFDRALALWRSPAGTPASRALDVIRDNPLAFGLITAGAVWLVVGGRREGEPRAAEAFPYDDEEVRAPLPAAWVEEPAAAEEEHIQSAEKNWETAMHTASDRASEMASQAKESVKHGAEVARTSAKHVAERVRTRAEQAGRSVRETTGRARERVSYATGNLKTTVREHPFAFAAIALALGAALGALLGRTRREDRLLGPSRDSLLERADRVGARTVEKARAAVERTAEAVKHKAEEVEERAAEGEQRATGERLEETRTVPPPGEEPPKA